MDDTPATSDRTAESAAQAFIDRWEPSGGSELSNYQSFLSELCDLLEVPHADLTRAFARH